MVFPLYDDNSDRRCIPYVNYSLIIINVLVFLVPQDMANDKNKFTHAWSVVPQEIVTGQDVAGRIEIENPINHQVVGTIDLEPTPFVYLTLLTSMFMHGSWMHLLGNMLFLWIFGDNVEDFLGPIRYLFFYVTVGLAASLAHVAVTYAFGMDPRIPCLGASGAISGVLSAYLLLYPNKQVMVILLRFMTWMPAFVVIGMWFAFQLINSLGILGDNSGGVAYGAHIGGFCAGFVLINAFGIGLDRPSYRQSQRAGYW